MNILKNVITASAVALVGIFSSSANARISGDQIIPRTETVLGKAVLNQNGKVNQCIYDNFMMKSGEDKPKHLVNLYKTLALTAVKKYVDDGETFDIVVNGALQDVCGNQAQDYSSTPTLDQTLISFFEERSSLFNESINQAQKYISSHNYINVAKEANLSNSTIHRLAVAKVDRGIEVKEFDVPMNKSVFTIDKVVALSDSIIEKSMKSQNSDFNQCVRENFVMEKEGDNPPLLGKLYSKLTNTITSDLVDDETTFTIAVNGLLKSACGDSQLTNGGNKKSK